MSNTQVWQKKNSVEKLKIPTVISNTMSIPDTIVETKILSSHTIKKPDIIRKHKFIYNQERMTRFLDDRCKQNLRICHYMNLDIHVPNVSFDISDSTTCETHKLSQSNASGSCVSSWRDELLKSQASKKVVQ